MTEDNGHPVPPDVSEVVRQLKRPTVKAARPVIRGALEVFGRVRGYGWVGVNAKQLHKINGPMVFAANHQSHADTAAILATLPRQIRKQTAVAAALDVFGRRKMSKARFRKISLEWVVAAGFQAFAFDRHGPPIRSVRTSIKLIRDGWNLLLYPEGTRSRDGEIQRFKSGVGVLARFTKASIIPVHVSGGRQVLPCGVKIPRRGLIVVRYGLPMYYEEGESPDNFVRRLQAKVQQLGSHQHDQSPVKRAAWLKTRRLREAISPHGRATPGLAFFSLRRKP